LAPMNSEKSSWVLLKTGRRELFVLVHLDLVAGLFA
jgi:hypothetical protein